MVLRLKPEAACHRDLQGRKRKRYKTQNAGALILGKLSQLNLPTSHGPTRNPHNPAHTPGGSSSGSAAAVGAGLCPLALGTQTIGSVIRPAAFCGVVGFKPTYERIPRDGVIPLSPSLDHIGFFTPDVETAKKVASVLIGDWRLETINRKPILGIPEGAYLTCASDYALTCFNAICDSLSDAGYELRRVRVMDDYQEIRNRHDVIMSTTRQMSIKNGLPNTNSLLIKIHRPYWCGQSVSNPQSHLKPAITFASNNSNHE